MDSYNTRKINLLGFNWEQFNLGNVFMKKKYTHLFITFIFLFTSCFTIPGYVDKDGNITPQYFKEIKIEAIKGNVSIIPFETSKGILNKNPTK